MVPYSTLTSQNLDSARPTVGTWMLNQLIDDSAHDTHKRCCQASQRAQFKECSLPFPSPSPLYPSPPFIAHPLTFQPSKLLVLLAGVNFGNLQSNLSCNGKKERERNARSTVYLTLKLQPLFNMFFFLMLLFFFKFQVRVHEVKSHVEKCFWIMIWDVWVWVWGVRTHRRYFIFCATTHRHVDQKQHPSY